MVMTKLEKPFGIHQLPDGYDPECCLQVLYRSGSEFQWIPVYGNPIPAYQNFIKYFREKNRLRKNEGVHNLLEADVLEVEWHATIHYHTFKYLLFETPEDKLEFLLTFG